MRIGTRRCERLPCLKNSTRLTPIHHLSPVYQTDDTRTFEPFVFLNFVALYRPLHVVFENVAAFTRHALPKPGSERGSFFKLFVSVLFGLGYQVRWQVVDAAG